ncbi:MAG: hypothetical protein EXQ71_01130 [Acidimicrobiia bacterium]|nr:hypothetical protein [Acidimicrobiia bacterium]
MVLAVYASHWYNLLLMGHVFSFAVAFAPLVGWRGRFGTQAQGELGASGVADHLARNTQWVHLPALVVTGLLGLALVFASGSPWDFSQTWLSLALLLWLALCGVVGGITGPALRRLAAGEASAGRQLRWGNDIATVVFLALGYLMFFKPGV